MGRKRKNFVRLCWKKQTFLSQLHLELRNKQENRLQTCIALCVFHGLLEILFRKFRTQNNFTPSIFAKFAPSELLNLSQKMKSFLFVGDRGLVISAKSWNRPCHFCGAGTLRQPRLNLLGSNHDYCQHSSASKTRQFWGSEGFLKEDVICGPQLHAPLYREWCRCKSVQCVHMGLPNFFSDSKQCFVCQGNSWFEYWKGRTWQYEAVRSGPHSLQLCQWREVWVDRHGRWSQLGTTRTAAWEHRTRTWRTETSCPTCTWFSSFWTPGLSTPSFHHILEICPYAFLVACLWKLNFVGFFPVKNNEKNNALRTRGCSWLTIEEEKLLRVFLHLPKTTSIRWILHVKIWPEQYKHV